MKVLVTGVSGLCGERIAEFLNKKGYDVTGTYRSRNVNCSYRTIKCDLSCPIDIDGEFDCIVHCAGQLPYSAPTMEEYVANNVDSMRNLLDFAHKKNVTRMIYLSTIGVYGEFYDDIVNEKTSIINPDNYGITKYISEKLLKEDQFVNGISVRCPGILGKSARGIWLSSLYEKFSEGKEITISNPDFLTRNVVHVDDLAEFVCILLHMDEWNYNEVVLASREGERVIRIAEIMKKALNSPSVIRCVKNGRKPFCLDPTIALGMGYDPMRIDEAIINYCNIKNADIDERKATDII